MILLHKRSSEVVKLFMSNIFTSFVYAFARQLLQEALLQQTCYVSQNLVNCRNKLYNKLQTPK